MPIKTKKRAKAGYMISAVAEIYKLHPQTLRLYERVGLLKPSRSQGNTRLYTDSDLERLDVILTLARDMGVNLAGIEIILNMREKMIEMERQMGEFAHVVQQELSRMARNEEKGAEYSDCQDGEEKFLVNGCQFSAQLSYWALRAIGAFFIFVHGFPQQERLWRAARGNMMAAEKLREDCSWL